MSATADGRSNTWRYALAPASDSTIPCLLSPDQYLDGSRHYLEWSLRRLELRRSGLFCLRQFAHRRPTAKKRSIYRPRRCKPNRIALFDPVHTCVCHRHSVTRSRSVSFHRVSGPQLPDRNTFLFGLVFPAEGDNKGRSGIGGRYRGRVVPWDSGQRFKGNYSTGYSAIIFVIFSPYLRRYQPGFAFPIFFVFCISTLKMFTDTDKKKAIFYALMSGLILAILVFSYFFLWTAALAWLGCFALLWFVCRKEDRQADASKHRRYRWIRGGLNNSLLSHACKSSSEYGRYPAFKLYAYAELV